MKKREERQKGTAPIKEAPANRPPQAPISKPVLPLEKLLSKSPIPFAASKRREQNRDRKEINKKELKEAIRDSLDLAHGELQPGQTVEF